MLCWLEVVGYNENLTQNPYTIKFCVKKIRNKRVPVAFIRFVDSSGNGHIVKKSKAGMVVVAKKIRLW